MVLRATGPCASTDRRMALALVRRRSLSTARRVREGGGVRTGLGAREGLGMERGMEDFLRNWVRHCADVCCLVSSRRAG
jgi:hypothetical protein